MEDRYHTTRSGERVLITDMSNSHLANTIRLLERNALQPDLCKVEILVPHDEDLYPVVESITPAEYLELANHQAYVDEAKRRLKKGQGKGPMFFLRNLRLRPG
jgi:hypothetical protein